MNGRTVVMPSRSGIMCRSISYGAAWGAAAGALISAVPAAVLAPMSLLVVPEIGAAVGAIAGSACGLTGGLGLVIFRRLASASRFVVHIAAGIGAGLLPGAWLVAGITGSGRLLSPVLALLTIVVVILAAALGPLAFYGRPSRRARRAGGPRRVPPES
jgi:hypothetical protein